MRIRFKPWAKDYLSKSEKSLELEKINLSTIENQKIHMEIGVGKGGFIIELAKRNPDILYIGIEKYSSVIALAVKKAERENINNIIFLNIDVDTLNDNDIFDNKISRIYLNFSDPWPKVRHHKRRLTSPKFLKLYEKLLIKKGEIFQKTDNIDLFEYSLEMFENEKWTLNNVEYDLHKSNYEGNIVTEYESKFSQKGFKINRLEAYKE